MIAIGAMLKVAGGFLKAIPWQAYAVAGVVSLGLFYGHLRFNAGKAKIQGKFDEYKTQVASDIAKQEAENKAKELKDRLAFDAAATLLEKRNADTKANAERTIADLRAGTLKLRNRFTCPAKATEVAGSSEGDNGTSEAGLLGADAEFLISEAERADKVVNQLTACQNVLKAEREVITNGKSD